MESNPICMKPPFYSLAARYFDSSSQQRPDQQSYVRTLNLFARENSKKTGLKSLDFFSLQPWLPKTAQDRKFILEMCLKAHLFSNLWVFSKDIDLLVKIFFPISNFVPVSYTWSLSVVEWFWTRDEAFLNCFCNFAS